MDEKCKCYRHVKVFTVQLRSPVICEEGHSWNYICPYNVSACPVQS